MRTGLCRVAAMGRGVYLLASVTVFTSISVRAQTNSWITPGSAKWEASANWSLGVPPGAGQTVFVANHGWKAVDIDNNTAANFPQTMRIDSLEINSPGTDTVNAVLMNYAGLQTPLTASNIEVSNNANMVILASAVDTGFLTVWPGGWVTQDVSSQVSVSNEFILSGTYYFTNGTLSVPLANGAGESVSGQFVQAGGSNFAVGLLVTGNYDISGGELVVPTPGAPGQVGILDFGNFVQSGGTVGNYLSVGQTGVSGGTYQLNGGLLSLASLNLPNGSDNGEVTGTDSSHVIQTGGTNVTGTIIVGQPLNGDPRLGIGTYSLSNGVLIDVSLGINGQGSFYQYGGVHSNAAMGFTGTELTSETPPFTNYFVPGSYFLSGGTFTSGDVGGSGAFFQTGGSCDITNLQLDNGQYSLTGGELTVSNMSVSAGANFTQTGGAVTQTGTLTLAGGNLTAGNGTQPFGELQLNGGASSNSTLTLAPGASVLHFANSSSLVWPGQDSLLISNWNGSLSGGGTDQIFFGNNNTGLTSLQLRQVQFINPPGLPSGTYSAEILSSGEVVPNQGPPQGLVNSWIKSASGNWDDATSWSLGILPSSSQSVMITNPGFKAVAIQPSTPVNFPGSMTVSNLTLSGGTNSFNLLLMNFVGAANPLVIGSSNTPGDLILSDTNSSIVMYFSGLVVNDVLATNNIRQGEFEVNGTFVQSENAEVLAGFLDLNGTYNFTNGMVFIGDQFINGTFNQYGGTNLGTVTFTDGGHYNLSNGMLEGHVGLDAPFAGIFNQSGGINASSLGLDGPGTYQLSGGLLVPGNLYGPSELDPSSFGAGAVVQTGGTDNAANISMGIGSYALEGGVLTASNLEVGPVSDREGSFGGLFTQGGGYFNSASVNIIGVYDTRFGLGASTYTLSGGELQTPTIAMTMGLIDQTGGTNNAGVITLDTVSSYALNGGVLIVSNLTENGQTAFSLVGSIQQSGGTNDVLGTLFVGGSSSYDFTNGLLIANNIHVAGQAMFVHAGGSFGELDNILLAGGSWVERTAGEQLGQLQLGSGTNSSLNLPSGSCVLRFANSSSVPWASGVVLRIQNWSGSLSGGGPQQVFIGTSASGLTAQQLSQVQFSNPAGLPAGTYSARILSDGEVVPNESIAASIAFSEQGNNLVLTWPTGCTLQSATNVQGPYIDVTNATSPDSINTTMKPEQFFRLRH